MPVTARATRKVVAHRGKEMALPCTGAPDGHDIEGLADEGPGFTWATYVDWTSQWTLLSQSCLRAALSNARMS